jgi:hypothetical protein
VLAPTASFASPKGVAADDACDNRDRGVRPRHRPVAFSTSTYAHSTESVNGESGVPVPGRTSTAFGARTDAPGGVGDTTHSGGGGLHPERDPDHHGDHDDHDHPVER